MRNPFKKYKVTEDVTVVYDTYKDGSYTRNKTLKVAKDTVLYGEKMTKGDVEVISFDAVELGVDEEIQINADKVKKVTPWGLIATAVVFVVCGIIYFVKRK